MLTQQLKSQILKRNELSLALLCSYFPFFYFLFVALTFFLLKIQASKRKGRKKEEDELREREGL